METTRAQDHQTRCVMDSSGYRLFSTGELGQAHAVAHRLLDAGRPHLGYRRLGQWLDGRIGHGSQWTHLQWHMMVFEIATGRWNEARNRFDAHLLPAVPAGDALTDGPAGLWRLALAASGSVELPWDVARKIALAHLDEPRDRYTTLHHLLALAGAGDGAAIARWLGRHSVSEARDETLHALGVALHALTRGELSLARRAFRAGLPQVSSLGGSRAQNELFVNLARRTTVAPGVALSAVSTNRHTGLTTQPS